MRILWGFILTASLFFSFGAKAGQLNFQELTLSCQRAVNTETRSILPVKYKALIQAFWNSGKEAAIDMRFISYSSFLEDALKSSEFSVAMEACFPGNIDGQNRFKAALIISDILGKVAVGALTVATGLAMDRLALAAGVQFYRWYRISQYSIMAVVSVFAVVGEWKKYRRLKYPDQALEDLQTKRKIQEQMKGLEEDIETMKSYLNAHPDDKQAEFHLENLMDLQKEALGELKAS